ncbi:erythromycin esterase family protein [Polaribacter sp. AHE13PA]|jgi:erythromycin esterase|uniref:erythromycin esterase family protein n=1 Tax=Polaribacter sp. AHE13PA TaxID=2745562 RepID=UPI001C4F9075|nr:erythromycin esterase family protein [Polaribacter sp. AHE13PA]QXP68473.1 erythromycin esterase family protein [Polaribacter sp. AHE13PA]
MKKTLLLSILFFSFQIIFSQINKDIYELNSIDNLLTEKVKKIIDTNISKKQTVFLGESVHYSGSDFLAKTEFIKYLVIEHNYKDIVFESDFFALLFEHDKRNLYTYWSKSNQCEELFKFLKENNVTIWGFDNKLYSRYSYLNFTRKLSEILKEVGIELETEFTRLIKLIIKNQYNSRKELSQKEVDYLKKYIIELQANEIIKSNKVWNQILKSIESAIKLYTIKDNNSDKNRIPIRDKQMAENLDFLVKTNPSKKFIIWLANGHMSKSNSELMKGETMGYQFRELNPNNSYHIAFGSIRLTERTEKNITKAGKKRNNVLSLLPSLESNYFLDSKKILSKNIELKNKIFNDMYIFNLPNNKTELLNHFDALVFIAFGEEVKYEK